MPMLEVSRESKLWSVWSSVTLGFLIVCQLLEETSAQARHNFTCGIQDQPFQSLAKLDNSSFLYFCVHFMPFGVKMGFPIKVDEYTVLEIPDSYDFVKDKAPETVIVHPQLGNTGYYGPANWYSVKSAKVVQPVMHLVIQVSEGNLVGMRWVDGCHGCNVSTPADCRKQTFSFIDYFRNGSVSQTNQVCGMNYCADTDKKHYCNLKLYIGWEGTDFNGNYLVTTSQMLPNFAKQNGPDMFENQKILKFAKPVNSRSNLDQEAEKRINDNNK